ncbi:hypothetical protein PDJAM_G00132180 [Pangasius djambal]|uniref:Uncharacterized protein n=1 Tax=Pangasius djambal TaxID=1691987 RepID=A0ACC5ZCX5_9TELE|nr:hypothetical protein [Pangasius djambal]
MPIILQCMSLDWGRKPPKHRENMQRPHTQGRGRNQTPNPGGARTPSLRPAHFRSAETPVSTRSSSQCWEKYELAGFRSIDKSL